MDGPKSEGAKSVALCNFQTQTQTMPHFHTQTYTLHNGNALNALSQNRTEARPSALRRHGHRIVVEATWHSCMARITVFMGRDSGVSPRDRAWLQFLCVLCIHTCLLDPNEQPRQRNPDTLKQIAHDMQHRTAEGHRAAPGASAVQGCTTHRGRGASHLTHAATHCVQTKRTSIASSNRGKHKC